MKTRSFTLLCALCILCALLVNAWAQSSYPANPAKPITRINRARSTQPGGVIMFDDPVQFNGGVIGSVDGASGTSGTFGLIVLSSSGAMYTGTGATVIFGGTNALAWGLANSAFDNQNVYVSSTLPACFSMEGSGTDHTLIVESSGLQGAAIVSLSQSGAPAIIAVQRSYYTAPVLQVVRDSQPGDPAATAPLLDVDASNETTGTTPIAQFKGCTALSGDNSVIISRRGSVILNSNGNSPPNPTPGEIAFFGGHFEGWNGTTWKQLDN